MVRLLAQMELALEELESSATEDAIAAEQAVDRVARMVRTDAVTPTPSGVTLKVGHSSGVEFKHPVQGSSADGDFHVASV